MPVVVVKGGATSGGQRAAASHTGSLATDDRVFDGMCRQAGVIRAGSIEEAYEVAATFATQPEPAGNRVAVVSTAGGWGVVTADAIAGTDLELLPLPDDLVAALDAELPPRWSRNNPIDMAGGETKDTITTVLEIVARHPSVDAVVLLGMGIQSNQARMEREGPFFPDHGLDRIVAFHDRQDHRYTAAAAELVDDAAQAGARGHRARRHLPGQRRGPGGRRERQGLLPLLEPGGERARPALAAVTVASATGRLRAATSLRGAASCRRAAPYARPDAPTDSRAGAGARPGGRPRPGRRLRLDQHARVRRGGEPARPRDAGPVGPPTPRSAGGSRGRCAAAGRAGADRGPGAAEQLPRGQGVRANDHRPARRPPAHAGVDREAAHGDGRSWPTSHRAPSSGPAPSPRVRRRAA